MFYIHPSLLFHFKSRNGIDMMLQSGALSYIFLWGFTLPGGATETHRGTGLTVLPYQVICPTPKSARQHSS